MAYTRIHAIKATVQKALKYICNPEKTDGQILIDSFACGIETAHYDFMDALSKSSGVGDKQAFHLIQSFAPGEVDFDVAHQVGMELADKLLENKYSYVIATHIDKEHCHNHIIFCAVDNVEHKNIMIASALIVILEICQMNFAENMDCRLLFRQGKKA